MRGCLALFPYGLRVSSGILDFLGIVWHRGRLRDAFLIGCALKMASLASLASLASCFYHVPAKGLKCEIELNSHVKRRPRHKSKRGFCILLVDGDFDANKQGLVR